MRFGSRRIVWSAVGTAAVWRWRGVRQRPGGPTQAPGAEPAAGRERVQERDRAARHSGRRVHGHDGRVLGGARVLVRGLPHRVIQRLGELRERRQPAQADGAPDGHHDAGHQQAVLRRPAGRHLLLAATAAATGRRSRRASSMLYGTPPPDELDVLLPPADPGGPDRRPDPRQVPAGRRRCAIGREAHELHREGDVLRLRAGGIPAAGRDLRARRRIREP